MNFRVLKLTGWILILCGIMFAVIGLYEFQRSMIVIEWSTASELDTAGFNIYRMNPPTNEKLKVNPVLIPGSSDPLSGGNYQFKDENIIPGMIYIYSLEEIEMSGGKNDLGEIEVRAEYGGWLEGLLSVFSVFFGGLILLLAGIKGR